MNPYEDLANAVIIQAAKDYNEALKALKKNSKCKPALIMKRDCECFFRSAWFTVLTNLNGDVFMERLKRGGGI